MRELDGGTGPDGTGIGKSRKERWWYRCWERGCGSSATVRMVPGIGTRGARREGMGAWLRHKHWWYNHRLEQEGDAPGREGAEGI